MTAGHSHSQAHAHQVTTATATSPAGTLRIYSPAGVVRSAAPLQRAVRRLGKLGFAVEVDEAARLKHQRFAGDDDARLAAIHRTAAARPGVAMASRGGYGLTRLLDRIDWKAIAKSVDSGTRWVGHSDLTALHLGLLARKGGVTWAGPLACDDFGRSEADGGVDDVTAGCFTEAMSGTLEAVGFRTGAGFDGLDVRGTLWGGNLCVVNSLLGTSHFPRVRGGVLFLEDVNEHPYRVERNLLQLYQAGVLDSQKAILLGAFTSWRKSPLDRGYSLAHAIERVRAATRTPILTGLPFGHVPTKVTLPVGAKTRMMVDGRQAYIAWD